MRPGSPHARVPTFRQWPHGPICWRELVAGPSVSVPEAIYRHGSGSGIQSDAYSGIVFRKLPLAGEMLAILFQGHMSMLNVHENHIFTYISVSYKLPIICTCPFHIFVIIYTFAFINFLIRITVTAKYVLMRWVYLILRVFIIMNII